MTRICGKPGVLAICLALLWPSVLVAGDEDREQAYKIYIDPETGKYTTEDPESTAAAESPVGRGDKLEHAPPPDLVWLLIGAGVLIALITGGLLTYQRKLAR